MGFVIEEGLIRTYQEGIDSIIDQLGKKVVLVMPQPETLCPNCYYDGRKKRSSNKYKSSNPNPAGPLNKTFVDGQICPVCQGRGKIKEEQRTIEIKATVRWSPKELITYVNGKIYIPNDICKIKTYSSYTNDIKTAIEFHVAAEEPIEGSPVLLKCRRDEGYVPRGLKYNRYVEAYLKRIT